jgi:hypothetical protein
MRIARLIFALIALATGIASAAVSELGTFVEFVPQTQRDSNQFGYGLVAFVLQQTDPDDIRPTFITHSADEFIRRFQQLPASIREHGIWITLAEKDPYSADEKTVLRTLEAGCKQHAIPMFIRTGMRTESWQQVSGKPQ